MRYPIAIEPGDDTHAWGVVVPDLPGCYSAGDNLDEAITNASEAITLWIETVLDDGGDIPKPGSIAALRENPEFAGWIWALADVDPGLAGGPDRASQHHPATPRARSSGCQGQGSG